MAPPKGNNRGNGVTGESLRYGYLLPKRQSLSPTTRDNGLRKAPGRGQRDGCVTDTNSNIEASRFSGKTISNDKNSNNQNIICAVLAYFLRGGVTLLFGSFLHRNFGFVSDFEFITSTQTSGRQSNA